jgi:hypothetical protein
MWVLHASREALDRGSRSCLVWSLRALGKFYWPELEVQIRPSRCPRWAVPLRGISGERRGQMERAEDEELREGWQ